MQLLCGEQETGQRLPVNVPDFVASPVVAHSRLGRMFYLLLTQWDLPKRTAIRPRQDGILAQILPELRATVFQMSLI
jgi:hypothetical protein